MERTVLKGLAVALEPSLPSSKPHSSVVLRGLVLTDGVKSGF
jgi:hypothetical protein